jgi:hypothetical protein
VTVSAEDMAALRALLTGDSEPFTRLAAASHAGQDVRLGVLTTMAFAAAARSRFLAGWSRADVIRYVAQTRTRYGLDDLIPSLAEDLLAAALGNQPLPAGADSAATAYAQLALLKSLTDDLGTPGLSQVLDEARVHADRWLGQHPENGALQPESP